MTLDDIIKLAEEAHVRYSPQAGWVANLPALERFAALVAAAEREACAKVCEARIGGAVQSNDWWAGFKESMRQCAAAIRARGQA